MNTEILSPSRRWSSLFPRFSLSTNCSAQIGSATLYRCLLFRSRSVIAKMNRCGYEQTFGEMSGPSASGSVLCPKPRRLSRFVPSINDQIRSPRWHINHQLEICDSKAGMELLDIILSKGSYGVEKPNTIGVASPPPYFCGSPPSRASNPVIQDAEFGSNKLSLFAPAPIPATTVHKGGSCVRVKFGHKPAAVRIEGFNCLSRDGNCSISAVA